MSEPAGERVPISGALPKMAIHPIEDTPEFAFILVRTRDSSGVVNWSYRTTEPPNREELLGALTVQVALLKKELRDEWEE